MIEALPYGEFSVTVEGEGRYRELGDLRKRRSLISQPIDKLGQTRSLYVDKYSFARIGHIPLQVQRFGKVEDVGTETDALDNAFDYDLSSRNH